MGWQQFHGGTILSPPFPEVEGRVRSKGFTLVEMIVATMLLALGVVGALACFSTGLRATSVAKEYTTIGLLARQKLAELETAREITEGGEQGDFSPQAPDYRWQVRIQRTRMSDLYRVHLTILWGVPGNERRAEFEMLLLSPGTSRPPEER